MSMEGDVFLELSPAALQPQVLAALTRFGNLSRVSEAVWEYAWLPLPSSATRGAPPWQLGPNQSMVYLEATRLFRWSVDALDLEVGSLSINLANALRITGICEYLLGTGVVGRFVCFPAPECGADFGAAALRRAFAYGTEPGTAPGAEAFVLGRTTFNTAAFGRLLFGDAGAGKPSVLAGLSEQLAVAQSERNASGAAAAQTAYSMVSPEEEINARLMRAIEALRSRSRGSV